MSYPVVDGPYGLQPQNLIGGQVFAGSTRSLPIAYNYGTNIFYGDLVVLTRGFINRAAIGATTAVNSVTGVFLGCSFTNPVTKQKQFSQYYPASTLAGDIMAIVADDPDTVYKAVVCSATTVIASGAVAMVGTNLSGIDNSGGNTTSGNSINAILAPTATPVTTILPFRCVGVVPDTAIALGTATFSSISTATITTTANVPFAIPVGTDVAWLAPNGSLVQTGSFVVTAVAANNTTSVVMNAAPTQTIGASSTLVFTKYQEILVKINLLTHGYYSSATA
jgi:hypothetical protein